MADDIITVFKSTETDFENNGFAVLDKSTKAEVTEDLNGTYELNLEYPLFGNTKWQYLVEDNIVKCPTPRGLQLFRIKYKTKIFNGIAIYALHIFYDLMDNFIESLSLTNTSGSNAFNLMLSSTQYAHNFKAYSDIQNLGTTTLGKINPVQAILSDSNCFLNVWGGELLRDNFDIHINGAIGEDRGFTIAYGKNMTGIQDKSDYSNIITRVMPIAKDEDGNDLKLPEKYIDSPIIGNYPHPKIISKEYSDLKVNSNAQNGDIVTKDDVYNQLRANVNNLYNNSNIDKPVLDLVVDFVDLSKTDEYKDLSILQQIYLGDIVTVKHLNIGINLKAKVTKYVYDAILQKYTSIELAGTTANGTTSISLADTINNVKLSVDDVAQITDKIKKAMGGYVVKRPGEILIMDTQSISTAQKVWRWNLNGLGYSGTGYNGTYGVAITMDGEIVADFIKTGSLDASLIKAGVITSKDGSFKLSLDSGSLTTYGVDTGYKALQFQNRTIKGYDFINANQQIWQIETERYEDSSGNANGAPIMGTSIISGGNFELEELGSGDVLIRVDNKCSDTSLRQLFGYLDNLLITSKDGHGGIQVQTGGNDALTLYGKLNCKNWDLNNVGPITVNGKTGWSGTTTINGIEMEFEHGVRVG